MTTNSSSKVTVARKRAFSRYHAAWATVLVYSGYNVRTLSLIDPGTEEIPGSSTPINNRFPPVFQATNGATWWIDERLVSFATAVRMAEYAGRLAMGSCAPQGTAVTTGLSDAEQALADEIVACRATHITRLARALYQAGQLDHDCVIHLISPLRSRKPRRSSER